MKTIELPLTNAYALGDYTACVYIGSEQTPVNLVLDTGSSTLSLDAKRYQPGADKSLKCTPVVQEVNYGIGGWAGALVHTRVGFGPGHSDAPFLEHAPLAVVESETANMFQNADGILGLAYHHLNKSFNLSSYFAKQAVNPPFSHPWPFTIDSKGEDGVLPPVFNSLKSFKSFLWDYPEYDVTPLFTALETHHKVANKFAFSVKRSSVHVGEKGQCITQGMTPEMQDDPLNRGVLVLGGGEECTHLYRGMFLTLPVLHDVYYNVELTAVQVGDNPPIPAAPLAEKDQPNYFSNAIIDTGASLTVLPADLFKAVCSQLKDSNPAFANLIEPFSDVQQQYKGIDSDSLNLDEWPTVYFLFNGKKRAGGKAESEAPIKLACRPENYWQLNTPSNGKACFKLLSQLPNWPNQSILGLPLISGYYTVFDRSVGGKGVVRFAEHGDGGSEK